MNKDSFQLQQLENLHHKSNLLEQLQQQASLQSRLVNKKVLPARFNLLAGAVAHYPWQFLLTVSLITAVIVRSFSKL